MSEKIPKSGYALIDWIDQFVTDPQLPNTSKGFGLLGTENERLALAFAKGMRSLADYLVEWKRAEIEQKMREDNPDVSEDDIAMAQAPSKFPDIFDTEGNLHKPLSPRSTSVVVGEGELGS